MTQSGHALCGDLGPLYPESCPLPRQRTRVVSTRQPHGGNGALGGMLRKMAYKGFVSIEQKMLNNADLLGDVG